MNNRDLTIRQTQGLPKTQDRLEGMFNHLWDLMDNHWYGGLDSMMLDSLQPKTKPFPKLDLMENKDAYFIDLAISGIDKDKVELEYQDDTLFIKYSDSGFVKEDVTYLRREISRKSFRRAVRFPAKVDANNITCKYNNGIISCTVPKLPLEEANKVIKIDIN